MEDKDMIEITIKYNRKTGNIHIDTDDEYNQADIVYMAECLKYVIMEQGSIEKRSGSDIK